MRPTILRSRLACVVMALVALFTTIPSAQSTLPHLRGIGEIREWFNAERGHVRLILLLSPT